MKSISILVVLVALSLQLLAMENDQNLVPSIDLKNMIEQAAEQFSTLRASSSNSKKYWKQAMIAHHVQSIIESEYFKNIKENEPIKSFFVSVPDDDEIIIPYVYRSINDYQGLERYIQKGFAAFEDIFDKHPSNVIR